MVEHAKKHHNRFFLNFEMTRELRADNVMEFIVPIVLGTFYIQQVFVNGYKLDFAIISKKDIRRLGRRFHTRGLDKDGNAANYVETECFVIVHDDGGCYRVVSFTQTRGSIPLYWSQRPNLKYNPPLKISTDHHGSLTAAKKHFDEQTSLYGAQILVNLIDKKRSQKIIGDAFSKLIKEINDPKLVYVWFDFHHECRKMKWENLAKLIQMVSKNLHEHQYFMAKFEPAFENLNNISLSNCAVVTQQLGVVRTNCMDCLDRTNVAQSVFSRVALHKQLFKMGIIPKPKGEPFEKFPYELEEAFREGWTQNANIISKLYSGTNALKTDFTRTGKRTTKGNVKDGIYSVWRYYANNFSDGYYEDCLDLMTRRLKVHSQRLQRRGALSPVMMSFFAFGTTIFFIKGFLDYCFPMKDEEGDSNWKFKTLHGLIMFATVLGFMRAAMTNGRKLIDAPTIIK